MDFKRMLEEQNRHPDTTEAQKAANEHRLMLYELLTRSRAPFEAGAYTDLHDERLKDPNYRFTPNVMLDS